MGGPTQSLLGVRIWVKRDGLGGWGFLIRIGKERTRG